MKAYQTNQAKLSGSDFREVNKKASLIYNKITKKSKRRPYIRSAYFNNQKVFLPIFWHHLYEKPSFKEKIRRLKLFPCALEVLKYSTYEPCSKNNPNKKEEILHRFFGLTKEHEIFYVQVKENKRTGEKWLISIFPEGDT